MPYVRESAAISPDQAAGNAPADADDELLALLLITSWALATGRTMPAGISPQLLSAEELISFWADDHIPAAAPRRARGGTVSRPAGRSPSPPADGQVCTLVTVDIAGFTRPDRDDDIRRYLHEELYRVLQEAFDGSGIPWDRCWHEDRGDGVLVIVPPGIGCKAVIDPLPERLRTLIRRYNHVCRPAADLQLRAAVHIGPVDHDGHGFIGSDIDFLFRMLEARPLRRTLAGSGSELALIVSDYVYGNVICRYPSLVSPQDFQPVRFQVKYTRASAWMYLPGAPSRYGICEPHEAITPEAAS
jgi:hypothetical protein